MINIIYILIGCCFGALILYGCLKPQLTRTIQKNEEIIQYNTRLKNETKDIELFLQQLNEQKKDLNNEIEFLSQEKEQAHKDYLILQVEKDNAKTAINDLKEQATKSAQIFEQQAVELATTNIEASMEKLKINYENAESDYLKESEEVMATCVQDLQSQMQNNQTQINKQADTLQKLINTVNAAVEAAKRAEEMRAAADFYKLQLSETDLQEIEMLRNVAPYLRDKEPLNKVIWKCYYEKPTTDLIGRVIGPGTHTGIYKITNLQNQMCYVGQAANLSDRWKQHIKRGLGAETPTKNKLYPAMMSFGPESFSFEVIEECDRSMLDSREDYWQDYFHAKDFGYSIK